MKNESQFEALIVRYLANETTAEEDKVVLLWINENAENRSFFERIQTAWTLLSVEQTINNSDTAAGWNTLQSKIVVDLPQPVVDDLRDLKRDSGSSLYKILKVVAVAAAVAGIIWFSNTWQVKESPKPVVQQTTIRDTMASFIRYEENVSGIPKQLDLSDGSTVMLTHNSTIEFQEPFASDRRTIKLDGKAEFAVSKDSSKPFVVLSDQLQTRVTGTRFTVTGFKNQDQITVQLFEGMVVVEPVANMKLSRSYELLPGEQLTYKKGSAAALVQQMYLKATVPPATSNALPADEPTLPVAGKGSWYMFNNQSLPDVFDRLQLLFSTKINYKRSELKNLYFIGTFKQTDSLEDILKAIAEINELKLTRQDSSYTIGK